MSVLTAARKNCRIWMVFLALAVLFVLTAGSASAQNNNSTILGVVKDSSGGVVPQAKVTVINTETADSRTVTTGDDGAYRVPALRPGHYSVKVEKDGFKTVTETSLTLDVTQELVVNSALEIGSAAQEVTVTGEAPVVNTTTSNLGGLVNDEQISDLPLNGRNYIDLSTLQPGVALYAINTKPGGGSNSGTWLSVNGAPIQSNNTTLDGAMLQNEFAASTGTISGNTLGVDGIKEYKVLSSVYDATYGMTMGSQFVMVSKGGTNQWHGDAFEYLRNNSLDARNFFDTPASSGGKRLPELRRNNFGGSAGGPIKKDKTFFYAVFEGLRQITGVTINNIVPSAACHNLVANTQSPGNFAFQTTAIATACASGLTGLDNLTATVIPANMVPLINLFPSPNFGTANWTTPAANRIGDNYGQIRFDQNISANDTFFGRYTIDWAPQLLANTYPEIWNLNVINHNQFLSFGETHIFSPVMLNTVRLSLSRTNFSVTQAITPGGPDLTQPQYQEIPGVAFGNETPGSGIAALSGWSGSYPARHIQNVITLSDDLFYTKGRHALKFGVLLNRYAALGLHQQYIGGNLTFPSLASYMQGIYNTYLGAPPNPQCVDATCRDVGRNWLYYTYGGYVQDDWRLTPRLTVNLGFRYEFHSTVNEIHGLQGRYLNFTNPAAGFSQGQPFQNKSYKRNFEPRVGFAWDVFGNGKTSVHGGFGMYDDVGNIGAALFVQAISDGGYSLFNTVLDSGNNSRRLSIPFQFAGVPGQSLNLETSNYYMKDPSSIQYNMTVEQQLPLGIGLSVSYVGYQGRHLWRSWEANPFVPTTNANGVQTWDPWSCGAGGMGLGAILQSSPCNMGVGVPAPFPNNPAYVRSANPNYGMSIIMETSGTSTYNGLQVGLTKHVSRGLEFTGNFTWSHATDGTEQQAYSGEGCGGNALPVDPYSSTIDRGASCYDRKYVTNVSILYHIPGLKADNFAAKFTRGWWMGNTVTMYTGSPITANIGSLDRAGSGVFTNNRPTLDRVDLGTSTTTVTLPVSGGSHTYTFIPFNASTVITGNPNNWFNPLMFQLEPDGQEGDSGRSLLRGPGAGTWNFSINKDTRLPFLGEQGNLEFRAEFFNLLNRANFAFLPSTQVFNGTLTDTLPYSEAPSGATTANPLGNVGKITSTATNSRQVQFALKVIF